MYATARAIQDRDRQGWQGRDHGAGALRHRPVCRCYQGLAPAASAATDPSDPDVSQEEDDALPDDRSVTIYYKPANSEWKTPKVHYGLGNDWEQPEADMTLDAQGYYTATINTKGKAIDFVFHDKDTDGWENPKDGGNYHANVGITHVGVSEQAATVGNPESIGAKTRLVVHYKPSSASDNRGVYVWGTDVNGGNMDAKHDAFIGTDCWGKVAVLNFDGKLRQVRLPRHHQRLEQVRRRP